MPAKGDGVTLTRVRGCVVATLHSSLGPSSFDDIGRALLDHLAKQPATAVIFDLSAVRLMDACEFAELSRLAETLRLLGSRAWMVGLSPGLVAYVVNSDISTLGLETARGLEEALDALQVGR